MQRRCFLKSSLGTAVALVTLDRSSPAADPKTVDSAASAVRYRLSLDVPTRLFDGRRCWCHPRAGVVPGAGRDGSPRVVMTMNTLELDGSDVFKAMYGLETDDLGKSWSAPQELQALAVRYETLDGQQRPVAVSDFWPAWHEASRTLLGTGHTVVYTPDWRVAQPRPRHAAYAAYDAAARQWRPWKKLQMPPGEQFQDSGAGCTQRCDLPDGGILLPFYFRPPSANSRVAVARCSFDGETLGYQEHGGALRIDDDTRGLHEPSLISLDGQFLLTLRNDRQGFVTRSADGLNFEPIRPWTFDDGSPLGNYNTQQHWVAQGGDVFLVYTRRGANNDHVFRHRAPLFMGRVDPERLCVIRETEQVLVPERGARLGNFGVTRISDRETWVTVAEWMQPRGVEKHGSDGSVYVARLKWEG